MGKCPDSGQALAYRRGPVSGLEPRTLPTRLIDGVVEQFEVGRRPAGFRTHDP